MVRVRWPPAPLCENEQLAAAVFLWGTQSWASVVRHAQSICTGVDGTEHWHRVQTGPPLLFTTSWCGGTAHFPPYFQALLDFRLSKLLFSTLGDGFLGSQRLCIGPALWMILVLHWEICWPAAIAIYIKGIFLPANPACVWKSLNRRSLLHLS